MNPGDSYANGIFEIPVRNDADFISTNDMLRISRLTFMLNQLRLSGDFNVLVDHTGSINGNKMLFVKSLSGALPQIRLDATASGAVNFHVQLFQPSSNCLTTWKSPATARRISLLVAHSPITGCRATSLSRARVT